MKRTRVKELFNQKDTFSQKKLKFMDGLGVIALKHNLVF